MTLAISNNNLNPQVQAHPAHVEQPSPTPQHQVVSLVDLVQHGIADLRREISDSNSVLRESAFWINATKDLGEALIRPFTDAGERRNFFLMFSTGAAAGIFTRFATRGTQNALLVHGLSFLINSAFLPIATRIVEHKKLDSSLIPEIGQSFFDIAGNHLLTAPLQSVLGPAAPFLLGGITLTVITTIRTEATNRAGLTHDSIEEHLDRVIQNSAFHYGSTIFGLGWEGTKRVAGRALELGFSPVLGVALGIGAGSIRLPRTRNTQVSYTANSNGILEARIQNKPLDFEVIQRIEAGHAGTKTYILFSKNAAGEKIAAVIDPVYEDVQNLTQIIDSSGAKLTHILATHVHADHVSGAGRLRAHYNREPQIVVGRKSGARNADVYVGEYRPLAPSSSIEFKTPTQIPFGKLKIEAIETPGHTEGCVTYQLADLLFTGDATLPGRTDFQRGNARNLYRSIQERILRDGEGKLRDETTYVLDGHDTRAAAARGSAQSLITLRELRENRFLKVNAQDLASKREELSKRREREVTEDEAREEIFVERREAADARMLVPERMGEAIPGNLDFNFVPGETPRGAFQRIAPERFLQFYTDPSSAPIVIDIRPSAEGEGLLFRPRLEELYHHIPLEMHFNKARYAEGISARSFHENNGEGLYQSEGYKRFIEDLEQGKISIEEDLPENATQTQTEQIQRNYFRFLMADRINVELNTLAVALRLRELNLDPHRPIAFVCERGVSSARNSESIARAYENLMGESSSPRRFYSVDGGMRGLVARQHLITGFEGSERSVPANPNLDNVFVVRRARGEELKTLRATGQAAPIVLQSSATDCSGNLASQRKPLPHQPVHRLTETALPFENLSVENFRRELANRQRERPLVLVEIRPPHDRRAGELGGKAPAHLKRVEAFLPREKSSETALEAIAEGSSDILYEGHRYNAEKFIENFDGALEHIPDNTDVVFVCNSGNQTGVIVSQALGQISPRLAKRRFYNLEGGVFAFNEALRQQALSLQQAQRASERRGGTS